MKSLGELDKKYDLELDKVVKKIKSSKAKLVLLQFPDGLKPYATAVVDFLEENTDAEFIIWMESCYGACDTPTEINNLNIDLVVQFGHSGKMPEY